MSRYSFEYDRHFYPPAPVIEIRLLSSQRISEPMMAFVDTGADSTIVPMSILGAISADYVDKAVLTGTTGSSERVGLYEIQVQIGEQMVYGVDAAAYGNEIILGRDVLNQLTIVLEGPLATCEVRI